MSMVNVRANRRRLTAAGLVAVLASAPAANAASTPQRAVCARDSAGALRVLALIPPAHWPAGGLRVDAGGRTLARLRPDPRALAELPQKDRQALKRLPARARAAHSGGATVIIYGRLLSDWRFARAAGMGGALTGAPRGIKEIQVQPLDARGHASGPALTCRLGPSRPPPAPAGLRAKMTGDGVALYWRPLAGRGLPVLSYRVQRNAGAGSEPLTGQAPFLPFNHPSKQPAYMDEAPPLEQNVTYQVRWVDPLGRAGAPARVRIYTMDLAALRPPARVTAERIPGGVALHWPKSDNPHTAGYVVERAYLNTGPYEVLTPNGLPAAKPEYRDQGLQGGTLYFYRVQAMGPRGDLGAPSDPVAIQARGTAAPPAPRRLKAALGRTRVRLTWEPLPGNVAGYIVERRAEGSPRWSRLNQELQQPPRYDDLLGAQAGGTLRYRVRAVSQDNQVSKPSKVLDVKLVDTAPPLPPQITAADGAGGKVTLRLRAARPAADTARIYVLRGGTARDPGLVIGKPLPGDGTRFDDTWVQPGKTYWYHLVAYDAAGNRSAGSTAVEVRVAAPQPPRPAAPKARFVARPLPMVRFEFRPPPRRLAVVVQSSRDGRHWLTAAGPTTQDHAQDLNPGSGAVQYRIRYQAVDGTLGPPSPPVTVRRK
ncbi:MAG: fibronectin type III domain-containing protein [Gammaproteobacteria bacterium]